MPANISSTHNPRVQLVRSLLRSPKERRENCLFIAEGMRLVEEALRAKWPFRFALASADLASRGLTLVEELRHHGVDVDTVRHDLLDSVSSTEASQGILAVLENTPLPLPDTMDFVLIPDQVRDPGNLGTLLRTAAAAGVQAALLSPQTAEAFAPKVVRAGMGAHFTLPIRHASWSEIRTLTQGLEIVLADKGAARPCWQADLRKPLALVVGGEAEGASERAHALAARSLSIPMPGGSESLNAAVAGAILMFEVVRQRL